MGRGPGSEGKPRVFRLFPRGPEAVMCTRADDVKKSITATGIKGCETLFCRLPQRWRWCCSRQFAAISRLIAFAEGQRRHVHASFRADALLRSTTAVPGKVAPVLLQL